MHKFDWQTEWQTHRLHRKMVIWRLKMSESQWPDQDWKILASMTRMDTRCWYRDSIEILADLCLLISGEGNDLRTLKWILCAGLEKFGIRGIQDTRQFALSLQSPVLFLRLGVHFTFAWGNHNNNHNKLGLSCAKLRASLYFRLSVNNFNRKISLEKSFLVQNNSSQ